MFIKEKVKIPKKNPLMKWFDDLMAEIGLEESKGERIAKEKREAEKKKKLSIKEEEQKVMKQALKQMEDRQNVLDTARRKKKNNERKIKYYILI